MRNSRNKTSGFTLIEVLVAVAVALILGVTALIGYNSAQKKLALERSAFRLAQEIRRAQEMAMAEEEYEAEGVPVGGYGIYLRKRPSPQDSYVLFRDLPDIYLPFDNPNQHYDPGSETVKVISCEEGVVIKDLGANHVNIIFKPPYPHVYIADNDGIDLGDETAIVLSLEEDSSVTKTIYVNKAGLIDVQN